MQAARFVAVTAALSAAVGFAGAWIAQAQGVDVNLWLSAGTAIVVGLFLALWWAAPKEHEPESEGFEIVATQEAEAVLTEREASRQAQDGRRDAGRSDDVPGGDAPSGGDAAPGGQRRD